MQDAHEATSGPSPSAPRTHTSPPAQTHPTITGSVRVYTEMDIHADPMPGEQDGQSRPHNNQSCQPCATNKRNHSGKKTEFPTKNRILKHKPLNHARHTSHAESMYMQ